MKTIIHNEWQEVLESEFESDYYAKLHAFLKNEYLSQTIYPDMYHIFEAFELTPFSDVKVVILGQDPYHGPNQAHGLSFSVLPGVVFGVYPATVAAKRSWNQAGQSRLSKKMGRARRVDAKLCFNGQERTGFFA